MLYRLMLSFAAACLLTFALPMTASADCGGCGHAEAGEGEHTHAEDGEGCGGCAGGEEASAGCNCGDGCESDCAGGGGDCDCAAEVVEEAAGGCGQDCAFCQGDATAECTCGQ